jgi:hypothetical protein
MRLTTFVVALMVSAAVAGCSVPGHSSAAPAPNPRPLDGVTTFAPAQSAALSDALQDATVTCMRQHGLQYVPIPAVQSPAALINPYGLLRTDLVRQDGYSIVSTILNRTAHPPVDPNSVVVAKLSPLALKKWNLAFFGADGARRNVVMPYKEGTISVPTAGCAYEAQVEIYGAGWYDTFYATEATANEVIFRVMAYAGYLKAVRAWSGCMRKAGERYATTDAVRADIKAQAGKAKTIAELQKVGKRELALSATDYTCERKVRLHEAVAEAQARLQPPLEEEHAGDIAEFKKLKAAALARVQ